MDSQPNWYVYLIGTVLGGYFKIGISTNYKKRLKQIQDGLPFDVSLLLVCQVPERLHADFIEKALFEKYWGNHLRGEWFTDINVIDFTEDVRHVWETKAKHLGFTANHCRSLLEVAVVPITVESTS